MYHTIQIVDFSEPIRLQNNTIDNRDGKLWISLKTVNFWVGYCNVRKKEKILRRRIGEGGDPIDNFQFIEPGLYNIKQIINIFVKNTPWLEFNINEKSGEFSLEI